MAARLRFSGAAFVGVSDLLDCVEGDKMKCIEITEMRLDGWVFSKPPRPKPKSKEDLSVCPKCKGSKNPDEDPTVCKPCLDRMREIAEAEGDVFA